jgi:hypothetical protein
MTAERDLNLTIFSLAEASADHANFRQIHSFGSHGKIAEKNAITNHLKEKISRKTTNQFVVHFKFHQVLWLLLVL